MQNNPERRNEREKRERNSLCRFFFHWNKKKKLKLQTSTSASKICPKNARPPSAGDFYWKVPLALSYLTRFSSYLAREQWKSMRYYHFFFLFRERSQRKRISDRKKKRSMTSSREERKRGPLRRIGKLAAVLNTSTAVGKAARLMETVSTRLFDFCIFFFCFPDGTDGKKAKHQPK